MGWRNLRWYVDTLSKGLDLLEGHRAGITVGGMILWTETNGRPRGRSIAILLILVDDPCR